MRLKDEQHFNLNDLSELPTKRFPFRASFPRYYIVQGSNSSPFFATLVPRSSHTHPQMGQKDGEKQDETYFEYYAQLAHQQNMLQDSIRTTTYQQAILANGPSDFVGKVVLDVGCGSGILSFFAAQAGAKRVYAVDAAKPMARCARRIAEANGYSAVKVLEGKIEEVELPEKVDVVISEPIGVLLLHERMCESFLYARDRWLKEGGRMFPASGTIYLAPFTDAAGYAETLNKARFWQSSNFYGVDISCLSRDALEHYFAQPVVGGFDGNSLLAPPFLHAVSFETARIEDIQRVSIPLVFSSQFTGVIHGIAGWFDLCFSGETTGPLVLNTSPLHDRTHWHQVRFFLKDPMAVNQGQQITGAFVMSANSRRSFDIALELAIESTSRRQTFLLHEQQYGNLGPVADTPREYLSMYQQH